MPFYSQFKLCEEQLEKIKLIEAELLAKGYGLMQTNYSMSPFCYEERSMIIFYKLSIRDTDSPVTLICTCLNRGLNSCESYGEIVKN